MVFNFNGTAVYMYGGRRSNHGLYSGTSTGIPAAVQLTDVTVEIDDTSLEYQSSYGIPDEVRQLLFSATGLSADRGHTVVSNRSQASGIAQLRQSYSSSLHCR